MRTALGIAGRGYYGLAQPTTLSIAGQGYYGQLVDAIIERVNGGSSAAKPRPRRHPYELEDEAAIIRFITAFMTEVINR